MKISPEERHFCNPAFRTKNTLSEIHATRHGLAVLIISIPHHRLLSSAAQLVAPPLFACCRCDGGLAAALARAGFYDFIANCAATSESSGEFLIF